MFEPLLRTRQIEIVHLKGKGEGWTLTVQHGIDEDDPITLGGARIDKFRVVPSEGGSVDLMFRIGSNDVDAEEAGLLCSKLSQEIVITLKAPQKPVDAIDGSKEAFDKDHPEAGDIFSQQHGDDPEDCESEGGEPDVADNYEKDVRDAGAAVSRIEAEQSSLNSKRTARGRERTKAALEAGMKAAEDGEAHPTH